MKTQEFRITEIKRRRRARGKKAIADILEGRSGDKAGLGKKKKRTILKKDS